MKKLLLLAAALILNATTAMAAETPVFDEAGAFVIARSVKLGEATMSVTTKTSETAQKTCAPGDSSCSGTTKCGSDSDCKEDEYCTSLKTCKPLCERGRTQDKEKCSGETPVCATDNHKSYCACNDESCGKAYKCGKTGNRFACEPCAAGDSCGCPAGTSSNGAGACVTCNKDADCADNQVCENKGTLAAQCKALTCDADKYAENHECKSCSGAISNCATCSSSSVCTGCQPGYNVVNGKCELRDCGAGMYLNMEDGQCYSCSNGCKSCTGPDSCTECEKAYNLESGYCIAKTCEEGMYLNSETGECLSCPSTCTTCATVMTSSETTQCITCAEGYKLDAATATCVPLNCAASEYVKGNECLPCSGSLSNCVACSGENTCTLCDNGFTLQNGKCVGVDCPAGTYLNMNKNPASCDSCASPCSTCSGTASTCTGCVDNYKLSGNSCVLKTCAELGSSLKTSCAESENATYVVSGSDGKCYSCLKKEGWCSSNSDCGTGHLKCANNSCVLKTCAEIDSTLKTGCAASENATDAHVTGSDGTCYTCSKKEGWCSSNSDCAYTEKCVSNSCVLKTCSEINSSYKTGCAAGESQAAAGVSGSDGTCYTCSKIEGWCSSNSDCGDNAKKCVNNGCVQKTCGEMGYLTSCDAGYTANGTGVTGSDGTCYTCSVKACPSGYSTSTTSCGNGYAFETNGYSAGLACGACVATACPSGYSTSTTSCDSCSTLYQSGYSAGKACGMCQRNSCKSVSCDASNGYTTSTDSCGCSVCVAAECPSGYSTHVTSCDPGYTLSTNGKSGGKACGKCEAASCPDGYFTHVTSCSGSEKLETNGSAGGKACGKCVLKTCAEQGYSTSCGTGYSKSSYGSNGSTFFNSWTGSDGTCYKCVKSECASGYSTSVTSCKSPQVLETFGYSGSEPCGKCVTKCGQYHKADENGVCRCTDYVEYDYGCGGTAVRKVCRSESVSADFGKSCTNSSQCIHGCASCDLIGADPAKRQGSTCR